MTIEPQEDIVKEMHQKWTNISGDKQQAVIILKYMVQKFLKAKSIEGYESSTHRVGLFNEFNSTAVGLFNKD